MRRARVNKASKIIIITGCDNVNINIMMKAYNILRSDHQGDSKECGDKLKVILHLSNPIMCPLLREGKSMVEIRNLMDIKIINIAELAARDVFTNEVADFLPVNPSSKKNMHYIIIGFGWFGQAVALKAAKMNHLAGRDNYCRTPEDSDSNPYVWAEDDSFTKSNKFKMSVFDKKTDMIDNFIARYPAIEGLL